MDNGEPTDQELFSEQFAPDTEAAETAAPAETTDKAPEDTPEAEAATADDAPGVEVDAEPAEQSQDSETRPAGETQAQTEEGESKGLVPSGVHREAKERARTAEAERDAERKEREALQRRLDMLEANVLRQQQPQPDQKPEDTLDFFADPEGAIKRLNETFEQKLTQQAIDFSLKSAHRAYGQEFDEAYNGLIQSNDTAAARAIMQAPDPGEALIIHHRRNRLLQETGGDLAGFTEKLKAKLLSDPEFQAKALEAARANASGTNASGTPNLNIPPSVNAGTRAGDARPTAMQAMSDEEEFADVMRR